MPDVKIYLPASLAEKPNLVRVMVSSMKEAVALHLECDVDGEPLLLNADDIDVMLIARENGSMVGSRLLIEVTAYEFPARMVNIDERLKAILKDGVPAGITPAGPIRRAAITFMPLHDGCWQATAD